MKKLFALCLVSLALLAGCKSTPKVPDSSTPVKEAVRIYPDYRDIVIPPNIAPLNIQVQSAGQAFVATFDGGGMQVVAGSDDGNTLKIDSTVWRQMLDKARGQSVRVTVYARRDGGWVRFPAYTLEVAREPIDRYLSYRLIEPGYEIYRQLGLYQRDLTSFDVHTIYENNRTFDNDNNHCINCHNYQNYSTRRMLFHVRSNHGGTLIADENGIRKMNVNCDSILASAVYPSWHPRRKWIAFSSNKTGQAFHLIDPQKVEVLDEAADLIFYDAEQGTVRNILKTESDFETFPCWSPDGRKLYYCVAHVPQLDALPDSLHQSYLLNHYDSLRNDIMSLSFDERTQQFGTPQLEVDCNALGKSATVPRVSPDGRYLLFTLGDYGQFHIWHKSADLYVKDLKNGQVRPLTEANSPDAESYHTWSSNGRWIVFSSRRDDGSYTRPYIAYFDTAGNAHKAFLLPQEDPEQNLLLLKSYNVPELSTDAVPYSADEFREVIYDDTNVEQAKFIR